MDVLAIIFLIAGWIANVKGLLIAAICLSSIVFVCLTAKSDKKGGDHFGILIGVVVLGLSIVKLCIG